MDDFTMLEMGMMVGLLAKRATVNPASRVTDVTEAKLIINNMRAQLDAIGQAGEIPMPVRSEPQQL